MKKRLTRIVGMGTTATVALALLTFGCVFAATAGPREALAARTQALHQTLSGTTPLAQTITASADWSQVETALAASNGFGGPPVNLTDSQLAEITRQLHDNYNHGVVHLAPPAQDWAGMTSGLQTVLSQLPGTKGIGVKLEIAYRQPMTQHMRLVAGRYPAPPPASGPNRATPDGSGVIRFTSVFQVAVSALTARQFGLHPGSKVKVAGGAIATTGREATITLDVTGIVAPADPSSAFWTADATLLEPGLQEVSTAFGPGDLWVGGVFSAPGSIDAMQRDFGVDGLAMQWELPMEFGSLGGQQAQPLLDALTQLSAQAPTLTGDVAPVSGALSVSSAMIRPLTLFLATAQAVDTVLWLVYISLAVAGLTVLLLAARMVVMRRSAELTLRRARGDALRQIAAATAGGAAVACVPAAIAAVVLAAVLIPGPVPPGGWWPPLAVLAVAICAPAVIGAWQQRLPRHAGRGRRRQRARVRLVVEVTAVAAAVAGVVVFRQQGVQAADGVNLFTSAAPALIAIPAVIVVLRVYPLVLRGLLRGYARRPGATAFLGLARAARTALTPALPAFVLVLALTVAAFAGMVRDAVTKGEVAASWQATGADASIMASTQQATGAALSPAALRALAAAPGVTHAARVWQEGWSTPDGTRVTGLAVDPAEYATLVAATQTFPTISARPLTAAAAGAPQPVLASPQAAADMGTGPVLLTTGAAVRPVKVQLAGVLSKTPALPAGGEFVIMPLTAIHSTATPPEPAAALVNELLLSGTGIDGARLTALANDVAPGSDVTLRSDELKSLTTAPLQRATFQLFGLALVVAAVLGLAVMLLELALGAGEREATLARLATMGLGEGQRTRVVALEVLPAVLAAAVAAWACAVALPRLVAPAMDLSVFTGSAAAVPLTPDTASIALPLAGLAVVALVALAIEIRSGRRRVAARLRTDE
jgi:putative ABC transport system permease protein